MFASIKRIAYVECYSCFKHLHFFYVLAPAEVSRICPVTLNFLWDTIIASKAVEARRLESTSSKRQHDAGIC
ncbi:uncharacterized protein PHALS_15079 [Plasmopara halstedii]|uniref:Uncharacterized protein n=1 Tax=Plasmopara halstedii TaxID=4781 RepID=A0A0P1B259_PLAHL|nr:uncharacterized protein PHALS_15079 [Plasmopara halstedii]CEG47844.1 hypothetical protein PHALS_15079 [Plasmopara halstedii]|eukprot:XP_024584213.1 hypothetical protein PHALS_15079 [Plasmopara halstedii]